MLWDVHYVEQTGSTNGDLLALARGGSPAGTVVRAGHQTAGRGRLGRSWLAPAGGSLLASILLEAEPVPFVVVARVALAAVDACRELAGVDATLKWPNDLMVDDRKLAGLLAESDSGSPTMVVGVGCNVTWPSGAVDEPAGSGGRAEPAEEDLRRLAAALADEAVVVPTPAALLDGLLDRLDDWLAVTPDRVLEAYRQRCATLGQDVRVELPGRTLAGRAVGITASGELEVAVGAATERVRAGDVVHVRPT